MHVDPMWHRMDPNRPGQGHGSYQATLRALGAYLDQECARRINVLEGDGNYTVRYQANPDDPAAVMVRLECVELLSLASQLERQRRRRPLFGREEQGSVNYENVLRALGYELDMAEAYSILIDEIDEGMVLTYQYLNPVEGFNAHKRMMILGPDATQAVLDAAEARRSRRKQGKSVLLAG